MLEIALDDSAGGVFQKDIAERQKISLKYLDFIIASLKTAGLIVNKRGRKSGYTLSRSPDEIKMLDIYRAFEPGINVVDCISGNYICDFRITCSVRDFWSELNDIIINYFESYTLGDLIRKHHEKISLQVPAGKVTGGVEQG